MSDLAHTHLVQRINRRAEMQEMSRLIMPLLYAIALIVVVSLLWIVTADYRDVAAHRMETLRIRVENDIISAKLVACVQGKAVPFNGQTMTCAIIPMVPL